MDTDHILLAPLETTPAYAVVVDRVRRAIALGVLLPGDRLPSERDFADRLGVSRVTVREALRVLQGEGLLHTKRGSGGTVVADLPRTQGPPHSGYEDELVEVFEFRLAVEGMAARLAARHSTAVDIEILLACQERMAASTSVDTFRRADSEFHLTVARMSGNGMLERSIHAARAAAFSWLDLRQFTVLKDSSIEGHAAIIAAIADHDAEVAATAMEHHIRHARGEVIAVIAAAEAADD
jgi:GntR family transcriptional repressor for pyruvate dehydrogenase complex